MRKKRIIKIINIVLVAVFVIAAFNVGRIYYNYNKADNTYKQIQNEYISPAEQPTLPEQTKAPEPSITVDFNALSQRNKDVVGWLYCPDTVISYPVVMGKDNDEYLHRDLDGKYLASGTLFADYRNGALSEGANYIIYGHNMKNGTMLASLAKYKKQEYFSQHPQMYYLTPEGNYRLELFAGLVVKRDDKIYMPNDNEEEFFKLINEYKAKSTFSSNVQLEQTDTVITLSTCSYEFDNARYIVLGKLLPIE